jgi:hypothetical protein
MTELMRMNHSNEKENYLQIDLKIESPSQNNKKSNSHISMKISNRMHISTLPSLSTY